MYTVYTAKRLFKKLKLWRVSSVWALKKAENGARFDLPQGTPPLLTA
ncbi:MAG: hypothetical protein LBC53_03695 [Spirochaetaceae bacterium]|nr:hypothetical protein [Spirochaetaceae bacterium]